MQAVATSTPTSLSTRVIEQAKTAAIETARIARDLAPTLLPVLFLYFVSEMMPQVAAAPAGRSKPVDAAMATMDAVLGPVYDTFQRTLLEIKDLNPLKFEETFACQAAYNILEQSTASLRSMRAMPVRCEGSEAECHDPMISKVIEETVVAEVGPMATQITAAISEWVERCRETLTRKG